MALSRRGFLAGIIATATAPAIVRSGLLMPVKPALVIPKGFGTITFGQNPNPGDTITINDRTWTFTSPGQGYSSTPLVTIVAGPQHSEFPTGWESSVRIA